MRQERNWGSALLVCGISAVAIAGLAMAGSSASPGQAVGSEEAATLRGGACYTLVTVGCTAVSPDCPGGNREDVAQGGSKGKTTGVVYCANDNNQCASYAAGRANCVRLPDEPIKEDPYPIEREDQSVAGF